MARQRRTPPLLLASAALIATFLPAIAAAATLATSPASAAPSTLPGTGTGTSYTLEGCRGSTTSTDYVPNGTVSYFPYATPTGSFICNKTSDYTTGNLGGGWNELDLVPGRVTVSAGNSAPSTPQNFDFAVAVDNCIWGDGSTGCATSGDRPGYDQLSQLTLNSGLSSGTCGTIGLEAPANLNGRANPGYLAPGIGGAGTSLYEIMKVTGQGKNSTCVYDFDARLAFNSHLYPGSSLHYDLANSGLDASQIGSKDVSIPVKSILPIGFTKQQDSSQGSTVDWGVSKTVTGSPNFSNTCDTTASNTSDVTVTVNWTKSTTLGGIVVHGVITIDNTAHRALDVTTTDQLYDGTSTNVASAQALNTDGDPQTKDAGQIDGGDTATVTDTWDPPMNVATDYSDVATGTITDPLFGGTVIGHPQAWATSTVTPEDPRSGGTAVVTDVEQLTDGYDPNASALGSTAASDYRFEITAVDFNNSGSSAGTLYTLYDPNNSANNQLYTLGTYTTGPITWVSDSQNAAGTVSFSKVVEFTRATEETATLGDVATVTGEGQGSHTYYGQAEITAGAQVSINVSKTTSVALSSDKTFTFNAYASGQAPPSGTIAGTTQIVVPAGSTGEPNPFTGTITGLDPGTQYWVDEPAVAPFPERVLPPDTDSDNSAYGLNPDGDSDDTGISVTLPTCSTTLNVTNTAAPAKAQVRKITFPNPAPTGASNWTFTLTGTEPGGTTAVSDLGGGSATSETQTATANGPYVPFASSLDQDGATYTITETKQTHWDPTVITGDVEGVANSTSRATTSLVTATCSFTLNLTTDTDQTFECTFTNVLRSDAKVTKTQNGVTPTLGYSFELKNADNTVPAFDQTLTTNSSNAGTLDFGYLPPAGDPTGSDGKYTLCELAVPAGTLSSLAAFPGATTNSTTGDVCYTFTLQPGSDQTFNIDNSTPGGAQRTIGYWKHWNSSTLGIQNFTVAADCPVLPQGNFLMDCFLPQTLANASGLYAGYTVTSAAQGVQILSNASSKYAENQLAAQLLAAELNVAAGASTCSGTINTVIAHAKTLLTNIHYIGINSAVVGPKSSLRNDFVNTAATLNTYNNGLLC